MGKIDADGLHFIQMCGARSSGIPITRVWEMSWCFFLAQGKDGCAGGVEIVCVSQDTRLQFLRHGTEKVQRGHAVRKLDAWR